MSLTARITWNADPSSKSHFIQYRVTGSPVWITPSVYNPTVNNFYDISGLQEGVTYDFKIISKCCNGSTEQIISAQTPCPTTSNLTTSPVANSVILNWDAKPWAVTYGVKYKKSTDSSYITPPGSPTASNTFTVTGLEYGSTYDFVVTVNCQTGESNGVSTSATIPCPSATGLSAVFDNTTANLSWTAGYTGQLFKVEYKKTSSSTWIVFSASQSGTTASITGLEYGTSYDFRVTGICGTATSTPVTTTAVSTCPEVTGLTATND